MPTIIPSPTLPPPTPLPPTTLPPTQLPPTQAIVPTHNPTLLPESSPTLVPTIVVTDPAQATATFQGTPTDMIPKQTLQSSETTDMPTVVTSPTSTLLTATPLPSQVGVELSQQPALLPESTPTVFAEATVAQPTLVATLIPSSASFAIMPQTVSEELITFAISAQGLQDVDSITILCIVDPTLLKGTQIWPSDSMLTNGNVMMGDDGFQPDGRWIFSATHINSMGLNQNDVLWMLQYQPIVSGYAQIICRPRLADASGQFMSLIESDFSVTVEVPGLLATATPTIIGDSPITVTEAVPTSTLSPTVDPTATPTPQATLTATVTPTVPVMTTLHGRIGMLHQAEQVTVTISGPSFNRAFTIQNDQAFAIELVPGQYVVSADAPHHLATVVSVTIGVDPMMLPITMLTGGDVNDDEVIDMVDVNLVASYLGWLVPGAPTQVDINGDGKVNINDLVLVTANLH
ncbi:MAG: hypothetical protein CL607_03185 [Anaerolineaceae bacterium]|nr:hypothetical protein [Anaerolineaceae bacterium]